MLSDSFGLKNWSVTCVEAGTLDRQACGLEHQGTTETRTIRYCIREGFDNWLVEAVACGHWDFVCFTLYKK